MASGKASRQQRATPRTSLAARAPAIIWHVAAILSCWYGFSSLDYLTQLTGERIDLQYGGHLQFLTICGLSASLLTMCVALLIDLVTPPEPVLFLKDLLTTIALPTESVISMLYWSLFVYNKDLLMPPKRIMDPDNPGQVLRVESIAVPFSMDASLHALPGVFLMIDFLFFSRQISPTIRLPPLAFGVTASYAVWAEHCAKMNGHFPYPLLDMLTQPQRVGLYAGCAMTATAVGLAAIKLHDAIDQAFGRNNAKKPVNAALKRS